MKIIIIVVGVAFVAVLGGLIAVSAMNVTIEKDTIRKEITLETEAPAPTALPVQ